MDSVVAIEMESWDLARRFLGRLRDYVYRGQEQSEWQLFSSLERVATRLNASDRMAEAESRMLLQFQRRAHQYLPTLPELDDTLGWLALIQHYGGPTRLLDFTRSAYVAAFFAMEKADGDAVIWAISETALLRQNAVALDSSRPELKLVTDPRCLAHANRALVSKAGQAGIMLIEPFRLDERISRQQGAFLVPLS